VGVGLVSPHDRSRIYTPHHQTTQSPYRFVYVSRGRPKTADPVYTHPNGHPQGIRLEYLLSRVLSGPRYNYILNYLLRRVEVHVLPRAFPPNLCNTVSGGFHRPTTLNISSSQWGPGWTLANLDPRGGRRFPFKYLARSSRLVDRAAARPHGPAQHTTTAALGDPRLRVRSPHRVVHISLMGCPHFLVFVVM
jgi:hypothetical protein